MNNKKQDNPSNDLIYVELSVVKLLQQLQVIESQETNHKDDAVNISNRRIYIAYSGGMDSSVLLHACIGLRQQKILNLPIYVWHVNHKVQPQSDEWEEHCKDLAKLYKVESRVSKVTGQAVKSESMEMFARRCRYDIWQKGLNSGDILLQAHHQRDQAETLLLKIVRASPNLKGIPQVRDINSVDELQLNKHQQYENLNQMALIARPLLNLNKQTITDYARKHKIKYVEDASNLDINYERNYIRHKILPLLEEKWRGAENGLAASAQRLGGYQQIISAKQSKLLEDFCITCGTSHKSPASIYDYRPVLQITRSDKHNHKSVLLPSLYELPSHEFELIIRAWLKKLSLAPPTTVGIKELHRQLNDGYKKKTIESGKGIVWQQGVIRSYRKNLHAIPPIAKSPDTKVLSVNLSPIPNSIKMPLGELFLDRVDKLDDYNKDIEAKAKTQGTIIYSVSLDWSKLASTSPIPPLTIVFRQGSEKMVIHDAGPTKELKNLFQEHSIPDWLRAFFPLIYANDKIIAIPGIGCHPMYRAEQGTDRPSLIISWMPLVDH